MSFHLTTSVSGTVQDGPAVDKVYVPLNGHDTKTVKKKALVAPGTCVATHPDAGVGDMHSPMVGTVVEVTDAFVLIEAGMPEPPKPKEGEEAPAAPEPPVVTKVDLSTLSGDGLKGALKGLGVDVGAIPFAPTLVVNGLNPEPGVTVVEQLLHDSRETLDAGLALIKKIDPGVKVVLAVAEGNAATLADCQVKHVRPVYPNSVDALVAAAVAGKECPEGVGVMSVCALYDLGRVAESGMPIIDTVLSVGGINYRVAIGTPLGAVLENANAKAQSGDTVVVGGPMRGVAVADLDAGVGKECDALTVIRAGAFPPVTDQACLNCGECVLRCPARIRPNLIGRYAEFKMMDKTREENIDACFECGLCGFYCTARRPLLQYIRLAKACLRQADAEAAGDE